jgi:hypothetical protein
MREADRHVDLAQLLVVERAIAYDDPDVAIEWPVLELRPSDRDAAAPRLAEVAAELPFVYAT